MPCHTLTVSQEFYIWAATNLAVQKLTISCLSSHSAKSAEPPAPQPLQYKAQNLSWNEHGRWFRAKPGAMSWGSQGETVFPLRALLRGTRVQLGWQLGMVMPWTATARCQSCCVKTPVVCKRRMRCAYSFWLLEKMWLESHDGQWLCL